MNGLSIIHLGGAGLETQMIRFIIRIHSTHSDKNTYRYAALLLHYQLWLWGHQHEAKQHFPTLEGYFSWRNFGWMPFGFWGIHLLGRVPTTFAFVGYKTSVSVIPVQAVMLLCAVCPVKTKIKDVQGSYFSKNIPWENGNQS